MEFARKLEDVRRTLASLGQNEQKDGGSKEQDQTSGGSRTGADESKSFLETNKESDSLQAAVNVTVGVVGIRHPRVCFKVIPVKVSSGRSAKEIVTYAFLDCGSDTSLCLKSLMEELEAQGRPVEFTMTTANFKGRQKSHETELTIQALDGSMKFEIDNVLTVNDIPVNSRHFASIKDLKKWPYLSGVHLPKINLKKVTVLIGNYCPKIVNDILESKWGRGVNLLQ